MLIFRHIAIVLLSLFTLFCISFLCIYDPKIILRYLRIFAIAIFDIGGFIRKEFWNYGCVTVTCSSHPLFAVNRGWCSVTLHLQSRKETSPPSPELASNGTCVRLIQPSIFWMRHLSVALKTIRSVVRYSDAVRIQRHSAVYKSGLVGRESPELIFKNIQPRIFKRVYTKFELLMWLKDSIFTIKSLLKITSRILIPFFYRPCLPSWLDLISNRLTANFSFSVIIMPFVCFLID